MPCNSQTSGKVTLRCLKLLAMGRAWLLRFAELKCWVGSYCLMEFRTHRLDPIIFLPGQLQLNHLRWSELDFLLPPQNPRHAEFHEHLGYLHPSRRWVLGHAVPHSWCLFSWLGYMALAFGITVREHHRFLFSMNGIQPHYFEMWIISWSWTLKF